MSTQGSDRGSEQQHGVVVPIDPRRPYVDGSAATPEQLRAEVDLHTGEQVQRVEEARDELAATLAELVARLDPRPRLQAAAERIVASTRRPGVIAPVAGVGVLVVLARLARARRGSRG
ncbi:DUF3618 domain-containing protein [Pseudonocardia lacus]|uniref:DUF3618 domain-containing protein n=1 Tax=Pseudonocardia lacus TaxID=2835865 RepID=UPI001BDBE875|nr:DUF3618 domain-containing protein [Pseudonocardia lacus]